MPAPAGSSSRTRSPDDLLDAIRVVAAGDALLAPAITRRLIEEFAARPAPSEAQKPSTGLTEREREVLGMVARGSPTARWRRSCS